MKVYAHYVEPEEYLGYDPLRSKMVTHNALGNQVRFTGLKFLSTDSTGQHLVHFKEDIDALVDQLQLCDCLWVHWSTLNADNICDLVAYVAEKGLYLGGFWGFVPGSKADISRKQFWGEFKISDEVNAFFCNTLHDHFLGYESGENDGRYIGSYALRSSEIGYSHYRGYREFQRFCEKISNSLHNRLAFLSSLNLVHYQAKDGDLVMLGTETAHALLNSQVGYAFVRGASRQYGILTFGNISAWNRWGYKTYNSGPSSDQGFECGPTKGASVSLMRRLLYQQYFYNCDLLGFTQSWLYGDDSEKRITGEVTGLNTSIDEMALTPLGEVQQCAKRIANQQGKLGVFYAPIAIMLDFFAGWVPPRHLYSSYIYKTWGNLPYRDGDYQTHALFSTLYPGYENAGWYRDETGFLCSTPYGEMTDVLLSDASPYVMQQYRAIFLTNNIHWSYEFYRRVLRYIKQGGHIIVCADAVQKAFTNLHQYVPDFLETFGLKALGEMVCLNDEKVFFNGYAYCQKGLEVLTCECLMDTQVVAHTSSTPVIVRSRQGAGEISIILSNNGLEKLDQEFLPYNLTDEDIVQPFVLTPCVQAYLASIYADLQLAKPDNNNLQYSVSVESDKQIVLQVTNNTHLTQRFQIVSPFPVKEIEVLPLTDGVQDCEGFYPENANINNTVENGSGLYALQAGDLAFYRICFSGSELEMMPKSPQKRRVENLYIKFLSGQDTLREFVLNHPTFTDTFTGISVDVMYFIRHDIRYLAEEAAFLRRRNVKIIVDFLPILNHYPQISFLRAFPERYQESVDIVSQVLLKLEPFDCTAIVVGVMKDSEIHGNISALKNDLVAAFQIIKNRTDIPLYFQNRPIMFPVNESYELAGSVGEMRLVLDMSAALCVAASIEGLEEQYHIHALSVSAPDIDAYGQYYDAHLPIVGSHHASQIREQVRTIINQQTEYVVMASDYTDWDQIMQDYYFLFEE